jgi:hypothetical protein
MHSTKNISSTSNSTGSQELTRTGDVGSSVSIKIIQKAGIKHLKEYLVKYERINLPFDESSVASKLNEVEKTDIKSLEGILCSKALWQKFATFLGSVNVNNRKKVQFCSQIRIQM